MRKNLFQQTSIIILFKLTVSGFLLLFGGSSLYAQSKDSIGHKKGDPPKVKVLPVPTLGYEPETKTYIGAAGLFTLDFYHDSTTRTSNTKIEFTYTWRNQIILESEWEYFFKGERWFTKGLLHYSRFPDFYYGVGPGTGENAELLFNSHRIIIDINAFKNIGGHHFAGLGIRYLSYRNITSDSINPYLELKNTSVFGIKGALVKDTRNNLLNTSKGEYYFIESDYNFGSPGYIRLMVDLRKYYTVKGNYTFALRLYNSFNFNTPAFFDYSVLGGDRFVRGYFYGRYRDNNLSTFQAEFRLPLFWRFGVAAIGGLSTVYPDFNSFANRIRPNYGGGLRFAVDKKDKINLRFDYVLGAEKQNGFYIAFGESF